MKICNRCNIERPLSDFYEDKRAAGGYCHRCRYCARAHRISKKLSIDPDYRCQTEELSNRKYITKCPYIIKKPNSIGENNPNWKGGRTKLSVLIKSLPEYSKWRQHIYMRDDYTCQICGVKNGSPKQIRLDVDHMYPFAKIMEDFNIQSVEDALNCKELWNTWNGRILCRPCHTTTDSYGLKGNKGWLKAPQNQPKMNN